MLALLEWHCGSAICIPSPDFRSDGVAHNGYDIFGVVYFPCFSTVGFCLRTSRASAFLPELSIKAVSCVFSFVVFVNVLRTEI